MASLNAKAMLEATFSFESAEKRKSPAGTPIKSPSKSTATILTQDGLSSSISTGTDLESLQNPSAFKPLTLLFASETDFPKESKSPKASGERKRKSTSKGGESPGRRESATSNGSLNLGSRSSGGEDTGSIGAVLKTEKEKSKSPAPRKKPKVTSSSVSTSTSPFDSGEETKCLQHGGMDDLTYDQHLGMIRDLGLQQQHQRNFTLSSSPFLQQNSQNVHSEEIPNHFHLTHHHQGSLKGRPGTASRDKSKSTTPNTTTPFGSGTVYQPAGPLIEPHKTTSVPAGLLPDSVRIPSDLKVTYQARPPPSSVVTGNPAARTSSENKKSEGRGSSSKHTPTTPASSQPSRSQNKQILYQPYKSTTTSTATSGTSMTVTSSSTKLTHQTSSFIHSPLAVSSTTLSATAGSMMMGSVGGPLGATGTLTQSAALSSHINPSSAIMTTGTAAGPGSLYFGYGHQSPFAPSKFPMVPPDSFRAQSPFGSPYLFPQTTPQTPPNYFMAPSFYNSQGLGSPGGSPLSQTRPLFHHPSVGSTVTGAPPFYQAQPPPSAHPVSNYYVAAPPVPTPSHHSMQPSTAPGHAGRSPHNPSSQPACPFPTESSQLSNNSTSSSNSSTNTNNNNKVNRSLLRKQPLQPISVTVPEDTAQAVAKSSGGPKLTKKLTQTNQLRQNSQETKQSAVQPSTPAGRTKKTVRQNPDPSTTITPIPPPTTQLENAKTFTEQYSLPDDITITPIIMSTSQSQANTFTAYGSTLAKPEKKKDIVHVIDTRSGESTTIAKHISINNLHRNNQSLPNVSSVKPNNAGNVGKISPSLDVIVLNSNKQSNAGNGLTSDHNRNGDDKNFSRSGLLISPGFNAERPNFKLQQLHSNSAGKTLLQANSNTNLVQPLYQGGVNAKSENKNRIIRRKGLTLNECIDGLQRKKMRILADTNVSITNVTPPANAGNNPPMPQQLTSDHNRLLSISITPHNHDQQPVFGNNLTLKGTKVSNGPGLTSKTNRKDVKPKQKSLKGVAIQPSKRQNAQARRSLNDNDFCTKLLDCNDAMAAVSALLVPSSSSASSIPATDAVSVQSYNLPDLQMTTVVKKRQPEKRSPLKIKLFKGGAGKITTRSNSQTPKLRARGNKIQDGESTGNAGGKGRANKLLIRHKDGNKSSGSLTPNLLPYSTSYGQTQGNGSSTLTTSNNHVILRIPKASERQGKMSYQLSSGNMTVNAMKKRAIVKPLSPSLINGATHSLTTGNKKLPIHTHPRWSNGWRFEGKAFEAKVYIKNDDNPVLRRCYPAMRHYGGDVIRARDCVLLKSGKKTDLPFVAKVATLFENPEDGEMMFSLLWYYRPEHTDIGRNKEDMLDEIFASKHRDSNSVATIEDKCYVFTFNEYCRYKKRLKQLLEGIPEATPIVPLSKSSTETRVPVTNFATDIANAVWQGMSTPLPNTDGGDKAESSGAGNVQPNANSLLMPVSRAHQSNHRSSGRHQPSSGKVSAEVVFFCRRVYDYRQKRMLKNPS